MHLPKGASLHLRTILLIRKTHRTIRGDWKVRIVTCTFQKLIWCWHVKKTKLQTQTPKTNPHTHQLLQFFCHSQQLFPRKHAFWPQCLQVKVARLARGSGLHSVTRSQSNYFATAYQLCDEVIRLATTFNKTTAGLNDFSRKLGHWVHYHFQKSSSSILGRSRRSLLPEPAGGKHSGWRCLYHSFSFLFFPLVPLRLLRLRLFFCFCFGRGSDSLAPGRLPEEQIK